MPPSAHRRTLSSVMAVLFVVSLSAYLGARPVAATTTLIGATQVATSLPPPATFNTNLLLAGSSNAAEPSIRTDRFGRSFVIAPIGVPAGCKAFRVTHDGSVSSFIGFPDHTAGGGDCDWAIGPQETAVLPGFGTPSDDALAYSSSFHKYKDPTAQPAVQYQFVKLVQAAACTRSITGMPTRPRRTRSSYVL